MKIIKGILIALTLVTLVGCGSSTTIGTVDTDDAESIRPTSTTVIDWTYSTEPASTVPVYTQETSTTTSNIQDGTVNVIEDSTKDDGNNTNNYKTEVGDTIQGVYELFAAVYNQTHNEYIYISDSSNDNKIYKLIKANEDVKVTREVTDEIHIDDKYNICILDENKEYYIISHPANMMSFSKIIDDYNIYINTVLKAGDMQTLTTTDIKEHTVKVQYTKVNKFSIETLDKAVDILEDKEYDYGY